MLGLWLRLGPTRPPGKDLGLGSGLDGLHLAPDEEKVGDHTPRRQELHDRVRVPPLSEYPVAGRVAQRVHREPAEGLPLALDVDDDVGQVDHEEEHEEGFGVEHEVEVLRHVGAEAV